MGSFASGAETYSQYQYKMLYSRQGYAPFVRVGVTAWDFRKDISVIVYSHRNAIDHPNFTVQIRVWATNNS